ncbi:MAG: hypothetical protein ACHQT9_04930 [Candidatus Saccharimonadales bacterium]
MSGIQPSRARPEIERNTSDPEPSAEINAAPAATLIEHDLYNLNVMAAGRLMVHGARNGYSGPAREWWVPSLQRVLGSVDLDEDSRIQLGEFSFENDMVPRDAANLVIAAYDRYLAPVESVVEA